MLKFLLTWTMITLGASGEPVKEVQTQILEFQDLEACQTYAATLQNQLYFLDLVYSIESVDHEVTCDHAKE